MPEDRPADGERRLLCRLEELVDGRSRGFDPLGEGRDSMFIVRRGDQVHGYRNACPHYDNARMAWRKNEFLNADRSRIMCGAHGALFRIEDGVCESGPCVGEALTSVPLSVIDGEVRLVGDYVSAKPGRFATAEPVPSAALSRSLANDTRSGAGNIMHFGLSTLRRGAGLPFAALIKDDHILPLSEVPELKGDDLLSILQAWPENIPALERAAATIGPENARLEDFRIELPYRPGQVFCTGANYKKHVVGLIMGDPTMRAPEDEAASDEERRAKAEAMMDLRAKSALPYVFIKLPSCAIGPQDDVVLPSNVEKPDWELELGVVIGRRAHHVREAEALDFVAGYAVVNDITAREHVWRRDNSAIGTDWLSGKCFPTFLPFGPMIVPKEAVPDPYALTIRLAVNGKVYQNESTGDMLHGIAKQIAYLSNRVVLEPGDLICTGSPYGNGSAFGITLHPGDVMEGSITGLGTQRNLCVAETAAKSN